MNPEIALEALIRWVSDATFLPAVATAVVVITAIAKRLPFLANVQAGAIMLAVQVLAWIAISVLRHFGVDETSISTGIEAFTTILNALSMIVLGSAASSWTYDKLRDLDVPYIGTSRHKNG